MIEVSGLSVNPMLLSITCRAGCSASAGLCMFIKMYKVDLCVLHTASCRAYPFSFLFLNNNAIRYRTLNSVLYSVDVLRTLKPFVTFFFSSTSSDSAYSVLFFFLLLQIVRSLISIFFCFIVILFCFDSLVLDEPSDPFSPVHGSDSGTYLRPPFKKPPLPRVLQQHPIASLDNLQGEPWVRVSGGRPPFF